jgi:hypothetical protein
MRLGIQKTVMIRLRAGPSIFQCVKTRTVSFGRRCRNAVATVVLGCSTCRTRLPGWGSPAHADRQGDEQLCFPEFGGVPMERRLLRDSTG